MIEIRKNIYFKRVETVDTTNSFFFFFSGVVGQLFDLFLAAASIPPTVISRIVTFAARGSLYGSHDLSTLRRGGGSSLPVTVTSEGLYIYHISLPNYTYILYIVCSGKRLGGHGSWMVVVAAHFSINLCTYMTYMYEMYKVVYMLHDTILPYYQRNRTIPQV